MVTNTVMWSPGVQLEELEKQAILAAFRHFRGNKTATATSLGIAIRTLDNKLEKYQVDDKATEERANEVYNEREEFLKAQRGLPSKWKPREVSNMAKRLQETRELKTKTDSGDDLQSVEENSEEQSVPMSVGKEVQGVSSKRAAGNHNRRGR